MLSKLISISLFSLGLLIWFVALAGAWKIAKAIVKKNKPRILREKEAMRKDWPMMIMPAMVFLAILILLLFFSEDRTLASQSVTFNPQIQYNSHWVLPVDYDKLWKAVALHESGLPKNRVPCATSWHKKARNCVSIMSWATGTRKLKNYATIEENKADFKRIWSTYYGDKLPTMKEAIRYSGNDNSKAWLTNTLHSYYSL